MYEKLINQPSKHQQPFNIRLNPIPFDEKVGYIDSVCAVLIESRFGPGRKWRRMTDLRMGPDREPVLTERGHSCPQVPQMISSYTILPDMARQCRSLRVSKGVTRNLRNYAQRLNKTVVLSALSVKPSLTRGPPQSRDAHSSPA